MNLRIETKFLLSLLMVLPHVMAGKSELQAVVKGNNEFTNQFYNAISQAEGNIFFSPISAHAVLALAYEGAQGATRDAFSKTLGVPGPIQTAEGYKDVMSYLNNIPDVQLLIANKIYTMRGFSLKLSFKDIAQKQFYSEVEALNFGESVDSAKKINTWVEEKTHNRIKDLIQPGDLNSLTRLVLVNAIYFKGKWQDEFDKNDTKTEKFYTNDKDSIDVQMMNKEEDCFYKEDSSLDAKVLMLPYSNPDVSLVVVLPNKRNGVGELEQKLAHYDITKLTEEMLVPTVIVKLPKFKIETTIDLKEPLEKMGLGIIFDGSRANFSGILEGEESIAVSKVIQKAFVEVNEEGTEAAAATGIIFTATSVALPPPPPKEFIADHPFIVYLQIKNGNSAPIVLFTGRISMPKI